MADGSEVGEPVATEPEALSAMLFSSDRNIMVWISLTSEYSGSQCMWALATRISCLSGGGFRPERAEERTEMRHPPPPPNGLVSTLKSRVAPPHHSPGFPTGAAAQLVSGQSLTARQLFLPPENRSSLTSSRTATPMLSLVITLFSMTSEPSEFAMAT